MLSFIVRGCFLLGILGWYSQSVWRMIDGYFRDQFQKYLHEEFEKNPKLRADLKAYSGHVGKAENRFADEEKSVLAQQPGIDIEETFWRAMPDGTPFHRFGDKNGVKQATIDKTTSNQRSTGDDNKPTPSAARTGATEKISVPYSVQFAAQDTQRKQNKKMKLQPKKLEQEELNEKSKKKRSKVKLLTLTDMDFNSIKKHKDDDFSKFDMEEDDDIDFDREMEEGILISELPYKPRLDLGGLQRVSEDEFCPLSAEDEFTCGDTIKWP